MRIISVRQNPEYKEKAIKYLQESWSEISPIIYEDCISNSIQATEFLLQRYLDEKIMAVQDGEFGYTDQWIPWQNDHFEKAFNCNS